MNLASATEAFLVSFVLVAPFVAFLRPRVLSLTAGATLVALGALVVEFLAQDALSPLYASAVILVLVAPPVEELLKFFVSEATGANFASASAAPGSGSLPPRTPSTSSRRGGSRPLSS